MSNEEILEVLRCNHLIRGEVYQRIINAMNEAREDEAIDFLKYVDKVSGLKDSYGGRLYPYQTLYNEFKKQSK